MPVSQALLAEEIRGPFEIISLSGELVYLFRGGQLWSQLIRRNPVTQRFQRVVGSLYGRRKWQMPPEATEPANIPTSNPRSSAIRVEIGSNTKPG